MKNKFKFLTTSLALAAIAGSALVLASCDDKTKDKVVDKVEQTAQKAKETVKEQVNSIKEFLGFSTDLESIAKSLSETKDKAAKEVLTTVNSNYIDYLAQASGIGKSSTEYKDLKDYQNKAIKFINSNVESFSMYNAFASDVYFEVMQMRIKDETATYPTLEALDGDYEKFKAKYLSMFTTNILNRLDIYKTTHYQNKMFSEGYKASNEAKMAMIVNDYIKVVNTLNQKSPICDNQEDNAQKAKCFVDHLSLVGNYPHIITTTSYLEAKNTDLADLITPEFTELAVDNIVQFQNDYVKEANLDK